MSLKIGNYFLWQRLALFLIILVAIFFRFYNIPERYGFDYDPTRDVLIVDYAAKTFHFPLIGPPSSIGPFTFGPWYYYQLILFKFIFPVAYSPWIYIGIASTVVVFLMYKIGVLLRGNALGLLLATLTAISPAETGQIRALSNPTLVPLYTALTIWLFIKLIKNKLSWWVVFLWGLALGIGINNHYQMLGLLILPFIFFIYKKEKRWINLISFASGITVSFLPLFIFNLTHDWSTVKGLIYYITQGSREMYIPNRWLYYVRDFWPTFTSYILGLPSYLGFYIILGIGVAVLYLAKQRKLSYLYVFLIIAFAINFFVLRYFPGQREYYYLLYLHPFIFMFFGLLISFMLNQKWGKCVGIILLLIVLISMTQQSIIRLRPSADQAKFKAEAAKIINTFPNRELVLYECAKSQRNMVRGIVFFLNNNKKVSEGIAKIAYPVDGCRLPDQDVFSTRYITSVDPIDITFASDNLLLEYGWKKVTPETVFLQLNQGK